MAETYSPDRTRARLVISTGSHVAGMRGVVFNKKTPKRQDMSLQGRMFCELLWFLGTCPHRDGM